MCTVIYLPTKKGVLFSSNRDENPQRLPAEKPMIKTGTDKTLLYPSDGLAGGTWIGLNNAGYLLVLLNGGFDNHTRKENYIKSRGIIVKEMLDSIDPIRSWNNTNLENIEPFTIIAYTKNALHQLVWTGMVKMHLRPCVNEAHIWSSSTLYNSKIKKTRELWFNNFVATNPDPGHQDLLGFLKKKQPDDIANNFVMDRGGKVKTCSISIIAIEETHARFDYYDLLDNELQSTSFHFDGQKKNKNVRSVITTHQTVAIL